MLHPNLQWLQDNIFHDIRQTFSLADPLAYVDYRSRKELPRVEAVYFLVHHETVMYVGQTANLKSRWNGHHLIKSVVFKDDWWLFWLPVQGSTLQLQVEHYAITTLRPRLNSQHNEAYYNPLPEVCAIPQLLTYPGHTSRHRFNYWMREFDIYYHWEGIMEARHNFYRNERALTKKLQKEAVRRQAAEKCRQTWATKKALKLAEFSTPASPIDLQPV